MAKTIEIPVALTHFQFLEGVKDRLNSLLDRQDAGEILSQSERHEAEGLVELMEFLSLIRLRVQQTLL
jgi:ribosome assembly protein YihI (activator of Der GTPase)